MSKIKIGGIIQSRDLAQVGITSTPDQRRAGALFKNLGAQGINIQFISEAVNGSGQRSLVFCVEKSDLPATLNLLRIGPEGIERTRIVTHSPVGIVSVFGPHFREKPSIAGTMFSALENSGIQILAISTSISTLSCVIEENSLPQAVQVISEVFELP
jgi:aspartokinase